MLKALLPIWRIFDYICGKRLAAILGEMAELLMRQGELKCDPETLAKLKRMSAMYTRSVNPLPFFHRAGAPFRVFSYMTQHGVRRPGRLRQFSLNEFAQCLTVNAFSGQTALGGFHDRTHFSH